MVHLELKGNVDGSVLRCIDARKPANSGLAIRIRVSVLGGGGADRIIFTAVSRPNFATKYSFCTVKLFRNLQDSQTFTLLETQF